MMSRTEILSAAFTNCSGVLTVENGVRKMSQRIPQEIIEEIRRQTNIVDVIGQYVQLKKSGKNYLGLCPFHNEHTPSFSVAEDKQMYHCFGCGKGGNIFQFLQEMDGISFPEAVEKVADIGNVSVEYEFGNLSGRNLDSTENKQYDALLKMHTRAAELYHHILLHTQIGEPALAYLKKRGMTQDQIEYFQIGFAPKERIVLKEIFQNDQVSEELLEKSGLMMQRQSGEWSDRFYQRIMFPIKSPQGKIIAFSGRILDDPNYDTKEMPKYLNSPETELFNKRKTLFHFDKARSEARKTQEIILFEGFMDVIAAWEAGIKSGVASMGTSLTSEQIQMIQRITSQVVICYDGDNAGLQATERAIQLLQDSSTLDMSVVRLPENLDPDEYLQKYGKEALAECVKHGRQTPFTFKLDYHKKGKNLENEQEQLIYLQEMIKELAQIPSVVEREIYTKQLAEATNLTQLSIQQEVGELRKKQRIKRQVERKTSNQQESRPEATTSIVHSQPRKINRVELAERILLFRVMSERVIQNQLLQQPDFHFVHDEYQEVFQHFNDYMSLHGNFEVADFLSYLKDERLKNLVATLNYMNLNEESSEREINDCLKILSISSVEQQLNEKLAQLQIAKKNGNKQNQTQLAIEIINLQKKIKNT